jgi:4-alpha-glucanotransferase
VTSARGGALWSIDDRKRAFCVTDVLARRPEAYHAKVRALAGKTSSGENDAGAPKSIHDIVHLKEEGLADILIYDPHQRLAFVDQFFGADLRMEELWRCSARDLGDFKESPYDLLQSAGGMGRLMLNRIGRVTSPEGKQVEVTLRKTISLEEASITVEYEIVPTEPLRSRLFATELSLILPSGPHPSCGYRILAGCDTVQESLTSKGANPNVSRVELCDPLSSMTLALLPSPPSTCVRFPLETVSQSESGIERTYQGSVVTLLWPCDLDAGQSLRPAVKLQVI